ncbi:recombinase family protein [Clostridium perfringens]|nr:recombinase family protein [Clostridium perfringens]
MSKIYGYCRVSTKKQLIDGYGLEVQEKEILEKYHNSEIYKEQYTGTTIERPILNELIGFLENGDTLVVTKLDRLARNTVEGIEIVQKLFNKGVSVHVLNIGLLENTSMGKFFLTTLLAVAEMERNTILERTQAGKEVARTKEGYKEGRPSKYRKEQLDHAIELLETHSYSQVEKITGISVSTLTREKRKRKALQ